MPSFARDLETTLHNALAEASKRRHEYATLEHLLIALIDDAHASQVMTSCGVNRDELKATVKQYLDGELGALVADSANHQRSHRSSRGWRRKRAVIRLALTSRSTVVCTWGEVDFARP